MRICLIDGCEKPATASRGWCWTHYGKFRRWGDPNGSWSQSDCAFDECDRPSRAGGYCDLHYRRKRRHGDPSVRLTTPPGPCMVDGCEGKGFGRGLCQRHYHHWRVSTDAGLAAHNANIELRRARLAGVEYERGLSWVTLMDRDAGVCHICLQTCDPTDFRVITDKNGRPRRIPGSAHPSLDHVVPLSKGGAHTDSNVALACLGCNRKKWAA
jgi:hypothetical protein